MATDFEILERLNKHISYAERKGNRAWLEGVLAPKLAFARADGRTFDDARGFLGKVKRSERRTTKIESIDVVGNRAVVKCVVTVHGEPDKRFHNLRLFVRAKSGWQLLGWANEPMP